MSDKETKLYKSLLGLVLFGGVLIAGACVSIYVLIHGWGLEPKSWPVIIGGIVYSWCSLGFMALIKLVLD